MTSMLERCAQDREWSIVYNECDMSYALNDIQGRLYRLPEHELRQAAQPGDSLAVAFAKALAARRSGAIMLTAALEE